MSDKWSKHVQGIYTLYLSRKLRFNDCFRAQYLSLFDLPEDAAFKMLDIGCGPAAPTAAYRRWYKNAEIYGLDLDENFLQFAKDNVPGVTFMEGSAEHLPFENDFLDVTISNTVSEHVRPDSFFGEQYRVLKKGGVCLVLSARKGINIPAYCLSDSAYEKAFWEKVHRYDRSMEEYQVCQYPMSEKELPAVMEKYGFKNVRCGYAVIPLTPDDPKYPEEMALEMIESGRMCALEAVHAAYQNLMEKISKEEVAEMCRLIQEKYDRRILQYKNREKQWNTNVSITMVVRGEKA